MTLTITAAFALHSAGTAYCPCPTPAGQAGLRPAATAVKQKAPLESAKEARDFSIRLLAQSFGLAPAGYAQLGYIECEMEVDVIQL